MRAIKELVAANMGITFMYRAAAEEEIKSGRMKIIDLPASP